MSELTVGARYAKSLIDLSLEENILEQVKNDMELFIDVVKQNHELYTVLRNPIISHDKKVKILEAIFGAKVSKATIAFFKIMITKSRGEVLYYTAQEFINQYNTKNNIVKALVTSATPLSAANQQQIAALVQAEIGGNIVLQTKVDPNLIGGFVLTVGDRQVDTSIASSLKKLKTEFAQKAV
ncbi:F-type H+-transporting ATPase subunit delta [Mucilaginibacter gracilis]|uniref:ATP synthase subunit delta n=1 Tax=Mucilaginibacter gracilis TaxID=423350 RepID=A0A495IYU2_9SPHI|nr:ATP synthase F1 subunit delta [Mucilaginibacter gracilis]RKR81673.1 F-type H+-transporting ATPase subunit delta [Mucilaginibacter gracilis]